MADTSGILSDINRKNQLQVIKRLKTFRIEGKPEQLPELVKLLNAVENEEIKTNIVQILNDVKNNAVVPVMIHEIARPENKNIQNILVSSCWQSGLDYSAYLDFFTDLLCSSNYITAIETFTVIEEMNMDTTTGQIEISVSKLKKAIKSMETDKQFLVKELIEILEHKKTAG